MQVKLSSFFELGRSTVLGNFEYIKFCSIIRYLPKILKKENKCTFKAYLPFDLFIEMSFESSLEAAKTRRDMVKRIIDHRGMDQIIVANGQNGDLGIISKISDITEIFKKDSKAGFSVTIASAPYPMHFIFNDIYKAEHCRSELFASVEESRRQRHRMKIVANA